MLNKFGHRMWVVFRARCDNRRNSCPYARCPWRLRAAGLPTLRRPSRAPAAGKVNRSRQARSRSSGPPQPRDVHAKIPGTAAGVVHQHSPRWPGTQPIPRHQDGRTARSAPQSSPSSHREWHEPPLYATSTRCESKVPFFMAAPAARYFCYNL